MNKPQLIVELQTHGLKLVEQEIGAAGRKGGAGPSDHKAVTVDGTTVMVPSYNSPAAQSPYSVGIDFTPNCLATFTAMLTRNTLRCGRWAKAQLEAAMSGHILAAAELIGRYARC